MSWWRRLLAWLRVRFVRYARRKMIGPHAVVDTSRRAVLREKPLTDTQRLLLETWFPPFRKLSKAQGAKLVADLQVFLAEKPIESEGVEIDERIRLVVAASACLLVLGLDIAAFDHVTRVVVRGEPFVDHGPDLMGRYRQADYPIAGKHGEVELLWSAIIEGVARAEGEHVVVHEFAHAFDHGLDLLQRHAERPAWEKSLARLPLHTRYTKTHQITRYAGNLEGAELFAVASELFFEVPRKLVTVAPTLFDELRRIYNVDSRSFTSQ